MVADGAHEALLPSERRRRILTILADRGACRVSVFSDALGVSEITIRRDLARLEQRGLVERTHGGAVPIRRIDLEPPYPEARSSHPAEKAAIGRVAAALVEDGDTVLLNDGTTTLEVFRAMRDRRVRAITNNVRVALETPEDGEVEVTLTGGRYRPRTDGTVGPIAEAALRSVYATKAFLGVEGLSPRHGLTSPSASEAAVAQLMGERTRGEIIVVADSSKLDIVADFVICDLDRVDIIVTDPAIGHENRGRLEERGVQVLVADPTEVRAASHDPAGVTVESTG